MNNQIKFLILGVVIFILAGALFYKHQQDQKFKAELVLAQQQRAKAIIEEKRKAFDIDEALKVNADHSASVFMDGKQAVIFTQEGTTVVEGVQVKDACRQMQTDLIVCGLNKNCPDFGVLKKVIVKWYKKHCLQ